VNALSIDKDKNILINRIYLRSKNNIIDINNINYINYINIINIINIF